LISNLVLFEANSKKKNMDLFKRIIKVFNNVNKDSGLKKSDIHKIVLIGGSYRIPKIQSLISEY